MGITSIIIILQYNLAVGEQMAPFKGKNYLLRNPSPPPSPPAKKKKNKSGYKHWALTGISGYVYKFKLDGGDGCSGPPPEDHPDAENVILSLCG